MLTVEMKINGTLIGQIYAHNKGYVKGSYNECRYGYHLYQMDTGMDGKPSIKEGTLIHNRPDGFNKLIKLILEDVENP